MTKKDLGFSMLAAALFDGALSQPAQSYRRWMLARVGETLGADGGLWRRAHAGELTHGLSVWSLEPGISRAWDRSAGINPLAMQLAAQPNTAATLAACCRPEALEDTRLHQRVLAPSGVSDVVGLSLLDPVLQLRTEVLFTRRPGRPVFEDAQVDRLDALGPIMVAATTQAYFLDLARRAASHAHRPAAVVDAAGRVLEAQHGFRALMQSHFPRWTGQSLPFALPESAHKQTLDAGDLKVYAEHLADLTLLRVWERDTLEGLSDREREVADRLVAGHTYKSIARDLAISPSTVANHVHRLYGKLGVSKRRELVALMRQ